MAVYLGEDRVGVSNYDSSNSDATVKFIDYDGTILHEYSVMDFMSSTSMPTNPTHTGLTAQGWNWTLTDAKAQLAAMPKAGLIIGQQYITSDEKTRLYCEFGKGTLNPYLYLGVNGTVNIDWGDGSSSTLTGSNIASPISVSHTYALPDSYVITLACGTSNTLYGFLSSTDEDDEDFSSVIMNPNVYSGRYTSELGYLGTIKKVEIGKNVMLDASAFAYCKSLKCITIPNNLVASTVLNDVFSYCTNLLYCTVPSGVINIPNLFYECFSLVYASIPKTITQLGSTFYNCSALRELVLPKDITTISNYVLYSCSNLERIEFPPSLTSIGAYSFYGCHTVTELTIPQALTTIGDHSLRYLYNLKNVTFQGNPARTFGKYALANSRVMSSITLPDNATYGEGLVYYSYALEKIENTTPAFFASASACGQCRCLRTVTIPEGTTSIGTSAFSSCYSLASITIPSTVTSVGNTAFESTKSLTEIHFLATTPPTISATTFSGIGSTVKIYVPSASLATYKAATNWSDIASQIYGE